LVLLYYGFTTRPLADALVQPLESYHRPPPAIPAGQDAIVLFVNDQLRLLPFTEKATIVGTRNADLLLCGLAYVQARIAPKVVLAEGALGVFSRRHANGTADLQEWAAFLGYPSNSTITSSEGVATHERAHAIGRLLGSNQRILLIDEAIHLPRSVAAFGKVGFTVTPIPCDYHNVPDDPWNVSDFVPHAGNLSALSEAVYEYVGLLTYWLRGFI
jgi:uncharacterized SAM-binding protein YcdF (DUF218 family)